MTISMRAEAEVGAFSLLACDTLSLTLSALGLPVTCPGVSNRVCLAQRETSKDIFLSDLTERHRRRPSVITLQELRHNSYLTSNNRRGWLPTK